MRRLCCQDCARMLSDTLMVCVSFATDVDWLNTPLLLINKKKVEREWGVIIRPIRANQSPWAVQSSPFSSNEAWSSIVDQGTHPESRLSSHRTQLKKKHQYFIKLLSLSGPDQSLDSHSPTGRDGSFVFAPQVEQQSDSVRFWKPCNTQPIHLTPYCLAFGRAGKRKGWDCEGENMFQRCPEIELLGLVVLYCFLFFSGRPRVEANSGCCTLYMKDCQSIAKVIPTVICIIIADIWITFLSSMIDFTCKVEMQTAVSCMLLFNKQK